MHTCIAECKVHDGTDRLYVLVWAEMGKRLRVRSSRFWDPVCWGFLMRLNKRGSWYVLRLVLCTALRCEGCLTFAVVCIAPLSVLQLGLLLLVLVGVISTFCMLLVVKCKYKLKERGVHVTRYGQIGYFAMGQTGQVVVNVALVVSQTGFAVACTFAVDGYVCITIPPFDLADTCATILAFEYW